MKKVKIVGAGLAGSEAALQLADNGWQVDLYEMRDKKTTSAHQTHLCAELVCSNSLKSTLLSSASGLLKAELEMMGCKLLPIAKKAAVPAGNALAVDRYLFSEYVHKTIINHPNIKLINEEVTAFDDTLTILATGPLSSDKITQSLIKDIGDNHLYFFDAIAPVVYTDTINMDIVFSKSRYSDDNSDYLNCPFNKDEYLNFVDALIKGEKYEAKEFESEFFNNIEYKFYENCIPIEELARRGVDTLRYGTMRPVGLDDPRTGKRPYALIQLRIENRNKTTYNLVGCQTMLKYGAQKDIFRLIPGLENADFARYGSIHRNTYINTAKVCNENFSLKNRSNIFVAGQLSGVEGYVESIFSGLLVANIINSKLPILPETTIMGQIWRFLTTEHKHFLPINANFGLLPAILDKIGKKEKKLEYSQRALSDLSSFLNSQQRSDHYEF
ncbi:MAG: methylenetetrahydrofolate--tRNA-(uracil(54)-C(5))-methyltransferase (FADH(2)-oxidizing) TrmFO [Candidatus Cloacimonetes bacterium]|nr:methylenetetrahydrofolate--tRNA-(uracil(54)-C(5))-methyltransferase (FADH(2)-oxidizing) TrmFO [Candidatus Cloacimonadota bacterium]